MSKRHRCWCAPPQQDSIRQASIRQIFAAKDIDVLYNIATNPRMIMIARRTLALSSLFGGLSASLKN
jgi:hypothetical protein